MTDKALDIEMAEAMERERERQRIAGLWANAKPQPIDESWGCMGDHQEPPELDGCARPLHHAAEEESEESEETLFERAGWL